MSGQKQLNQSGSRIIHIHPSSSLVSPGSLYDGASQTMALVKVGGSTPAKAAGKVVFGPKSHASD